MSNSKTRTEIERLVETLDDVQISEDEGRDAIKRLGIDTKAWAKAIKAKVAEAVSNQRKARFDEARKAYAADLGKLASRRAEPRRSIEQQREKVKTLLGRAPREMVVSMHFHKFEEATAEELSEMVRSLRHLLGEMGDDDEDG